MKSLCVVVLVWWSIVSDEPAVGHVVPQHSPLLLKTNGNNVEVYGNSGNGGSWLQMVLVFTRDTPNNQSTSLIDNEPSNRSSNGAIESPENAIKCKESFIQLASHCYQFINQKIGWHDALALCQSVGTTLAHPMNAIENLALINHLRINFDHTLSWWLGGSDEAKEGEWVWAHSKQPIVYTDWATGQPDDIGNNQDCLHYHRPIGWKWNDVPCNSPYQFICQQ